MSESFSSEALGRFARGEVPLDEWMHTYWAIKADPEAQRQVAESIASVTDETRRSQLQELHEVLSDAQERTTKAIHQGTTGEDFLQ